MAKAQQQITAVETKITEVEHLLDNAGERCTKAMGRMLEQLRAWDRARAALNEEITGRMKAEFVSKVIKGIYFWFRPTGRKRPLVEILRYKVVPVGRDVNDDPDNDDGGGGGNGPPNPGQNGGNGQNGKYPFVTTGTRCGITVVHDSRGGWTGSGCCREQVG